MELKFVVEFRGGFVGSEHPWLKRVLIDNDSVPAWSAAANRLLGNVQYQVLQWSSPPGGDANRFSLDVVYLDGERANERVSVRIVPVLVVGDRRFMLTEDTAELT